MKKILATLTLMAFATNATAAGVPIGFINAKTGKQAQIGENLTNAVTLAIEDLHKRGINVDLKSADDQGKPDVSLSAFEKLVNSDNVVGVVGSYTSATSSAIAKRAKQYKISLAVPIAASEDITQQLNEWVFRTNAPSSQYSPVLLDAVMSLDKSLKTFALIGINDAFGISVMRQAQIHAKKLGLREVAFEKYAEGQIDFRSTLSKVKEAKPDIIINTSYDIDSMLLMRQARELGLTPKAFLGAGGGYVTDAFLKEPAISTNVLASTQWTKDVNWKGAKEFNKRYTDKFGKAPTYHAACAYQTMIIMAECASKATGKNLAELRESTRKNLRNGEWDGILGKVKYTDYERFTNQNNHQMLVQQAQGGEYKTVYPPKFANAKIKYPFSWK